MTSHRLIIAVCTFAAAGWSTACRDEAKHEGHAPAAAGAESAGGHAHGHGEGEVAPVPADFEGPGKLALPDDLRALIVAEMVQVEAAMQQTLSAMVRGELPAVETAARGVHDSFVLAQKLTPEQAESLGKLLPPEFVSLDQQFHTQAKHLAEAAAAGDAVRASQVYAEMSTGCVGCHRAYARERFPGLAGPGHAQHPPSPSAEH